MTCKINLNKLSERANVVSVKGSNFTAEKVFCSRYAFFTIKKCTPTKFLYNSICDNQTVKKLGQCQPRTDLFKMCYNFPVPINIYRKIKNNINEFMFSLSYNSVNQSMCWAGTGS